MGSVDYDNRILFEFEQNSTVEVILLINISSHDDVY